MTDKALFLMPYSFYLEVDYGRLYLRSMFQKDVGSVADKIKRGIWEYLRRRKHFADINSAGAATEANAKYLDSLEGRMGQLTATFQEFSTNALNTDAFKSVLSLATNVVDVLSEIVGNIHLLIPAIAAVVSFVKSQKNVGRGKLYPPINSGKMPTAIVFYFDRNSFAFAPAEIQQGKRVLPLSA